VRAFHLSGVLLSIGEREVLPEVRLSRKWRDQPSIALGAAARHQATRANPLPRRLLAAYCFAANDDAKQNACLGEGELHKG